MPPGDRASWTPIRRSGAWSGSAPAARGGFSLVEVLIAVIVLAVGLLGMAGLQISALKANESALFRTVAVQATLDLADRLRADPAAILGPNGLSTVLTTCTGTLSARWKKDFCAFGLPAPHSSQSVAAIDCSNASADTGCGNGNCEISVRWEDSRAQPGAESHNAVFTVCTRLPAL